MPNLVSQGVSFQVLDLSQSPGSVQYPSVGANVLTHFEEEEEEEKGTYGGGGRARRRGGRRRKKKKEE